MNIGVVCWEFPPMVSGVNRHLGTIYPETAKRKHKVFVLTSTHKKVPNQHNFKSVRVMRTNKMVPLNVLKWIDQKKDVEVIANKMFSEFIKKNKIDVIHVHAFNHADYFLYAKALTCICKKNKIPCISMIHNDYTQLGSKANRKHIIEKLSWTKYVTFSNFMLKIYKKQHPSVKKNKWIIIRYGVDLNLFHSVSEQQKKKLKKRYGFAKKPVIFLPTRLHRKKGIVEALKAIDIIRQRFPNVILVLASAHKRYVVLYEAGAFEKYWEQIISTIKKLNLEKNVSIKEYDELRDIPKICALSDIVINPSVYVDEPFGLVPVEGMACGIPVIVTKSGGLVESVKDGITGFTINKDPAKVPRELARKICYLLQNPALRIKLGENGRKRVEQFFDKRITAQEFINLSTKLLIKFR